MTNLKCTKLKTQISNDKLWRKIAREPKLALLVEELHLDEEKEEKNYKKDKMLDRLASLCLVRTCLPHFVNVTRIVLTGHYKIPTCQFIDLNFPKLRKLKIYIKESMASQVSVLYRCLKCPTLCSHVYIIILKQVQPFQSE